MMMMIMMTMKMIIMDDDRLFVQERAPSCERDFDNLSILMT
jgi:hypothetical protein